MAITDKLNEARRHAVSLPADVPDGIVPALMALADAIELAGGQAARAGALSPVRAATTQDTEGEYGRPTGVTTDCLEGPGTVDGVRLREGDGVLVWRQRKPVQNGIYTVAGFVGDRAVMMRRSDAARLLAGGVLVFIDEGLTLRDHLFYLATNGDVRPGDDPMIWNHFPMGIITAMNIGDGSGLLRATAGGHAKLRTLVGEGGIHVEARGDQLVIRREAAAADPEPPVASLSLGRIPVPAPLGAPLPDDLITYEAWTRPAGAAQTLVIRYTFDHAVANAAFPIPAQVPVGRELLLINDAHPVAVRAVEGTEVWIRKAAAAAPDERAVALRSLGLVNDRWLWIASDPLHRTR